MWKLFNALNVRKPIARERGECLCPTDVDPLWLELDSAAPGPDRLGDDVSFDDAMHFHFVDGTSLLLFPDGTRIGEWPIDGAPLVVADDVR